MLVLGVLSFIQCLILLIIVDQYVGLPGNKLMLFISLFMCSLGGTSLGLLLSSVVGNEDKAVALVPLLIIPQILFSEILIPSDLHQGITVWIEKMMLVKWGYESMKQITGSTINYGIITQDICILLLFTIAFLIISIASMKISE
jgi:ABC-2 type transport system permease protein